MAASAARELDEAVLQNPATQIHIELFLKHAVGDVIADGSPVAMIYRHPLAALPIDIVDCDRSVDCLHLPSFADELCAAYATAGIGERCLATYSADPAELYVPALPLLRLERKEVSASFQQRYSQHAGVI